jgi:hypothetical protein
MSDARTRRALLKSAPRDPSRHAPKPRLAEAVGRHVRTSVTAAGALRHTPLSSGVARPRLSDLRGVHAPERVIVLVPLAL